ncbi:ribonuclease H-like domain-containing protein [Artemisia annua]|uniref:Ribonuclease H-like domain-containing protein n=1 Tax=Artemisia annua TaxID=35608 RepID=A0A2U1LCV6_ARTAN|nr:ribonuclease H-like domain-containing protein [Artemisia annua]
MAPGEASGRDSPVEDGSEPSSSDAASTHTDTAQMHQEDWGSATHFGDQNWSEGNMFQNENVPSQTVNVNDDVQTPVLRRSDRESKMPVINDYVLSAKVKYGIEKYVNYGRLNMYNKCFASTLNKYNEPTSYEEAWSQSPNDEGRDSPVEDGSEPSSSDAPSTHTDTAQMHQEDWGSATHFGDQNWSEGKMFQNENIPSQTVNVNDDVQTPVLRRSDRESKIPVINDYVLSAKVKYGIEKYVNYVLPFGRHAIGDLSTGVGVKTGEESASDKEVQLEEGC